MSFYKKEEYNSITEKSNILIDKIFFPTINSSEVSKQCGT